MSATDPVKHCPVYKNEGCSHVDGYLCDYPSCSIVKEYMKEELIQSIVDQCVVTRVRNDTTVQVLQSRKFAELIVRECIGCCEQVISDPVPESVNTWLNGGEQCIDEIKKHFGVD